jgi:hypothetical protein
VIHRFTQAAIPLFPLAWGLRRAVGVQEELPTVDASGPLAVEQLLGGAIDWGLQPRASPSGMPVVGQYRVIG